MTLPLDLPDDLTEIFLLEEEAFRAIGEELLERAKQVAHTTEERVHSLVTPDGPMVAG
jgi:hypothetical protein